MCVLYERQSDTEQHYLDKTLEKKIRGRNASGYQNSSKLWYETKQTILHPLTEVRGRKFCLNGQQAKSVDCSSNISSDKTLEKQIRGRNAKFSFDKKQSSLGSSSTILHPLTEVRGQKICSNGQQAKSVDCSSNISSDKFLEKQIRGRNTSGY